MVETSAPNEKAPATENRQEKLEIPIASPRKKIAKKQPPFKFSGLKLLRARNLPIRRRRPCQV